MTSARKVLADNLLDIEDHVGLVRTAEQEADRLLTALESAGWVVVPKVETEIEVTDAMLEAGLLAFYGVILSWEDAEREEKRLALEAVYRAMLKSSLGDESSVSEANPYSPKPSVSARRELR